MLLSAVVKNSTQEKARDGSAPLVAIVPRTKSSEAIVVVRGGMNVDLAAIDPGAARVVSKSKAAAQTKKLQKRFSALQETLYAEHARSLLIVVQAMDTGGKDGAIKKLCSGLDPNGVQVTNFKFPTPEEFDHDFLWRVHHAAPRKGSIGIWNRSQYEDVLVPRVHKQISDAVWRARCEDINALERLLTRNGVTLLKFFLHISKDEQKARLEARLQDREKLWKFNPGDLKERARWADYQLAYEGVMKRCSTEDAPWHIVAANHKWSRNLVMLETVVGALERMKPQYPKPAFDPKSVVIE